MIPFKCPFCSVLYYLDESERPLLVHECPVTHQYNRGIRVRFTVTAHPAGEGV